MSGMCAAEYGVWLKECIEEIVQKMIRDKQFVDKDKVRGNELIKRRYIDEYVEGNWIFSIVVVAG